MIGYNNLQSNDKLDKVKLGKSMDFEKLVRVCDSLEAPLEDKEFLKKLDKWYKKVYKKHT